MIKHTHSIQRGIPHQTAGTRQVKRQKNKNLKALKVQKTVFYAEQNYYWNNDKGIFKHTKAERCQHIHTTWIINGILSDRTKRW